MDKAIFWGIDRDELTPDEQRRTDACARSLGLKQEYLRDKTKWKNLDLKKYSIAIGPFPVNRITEASQLKWFQQFGTGTDWLLKNAEAKSMDFTLTNVSDIHYISLAEHAILGWLAWSRWLPHAFKSQLNHTWEQPSWDEKDTFELAGSTLLIAGLGSIGQRIAKLAKAFDVYVIGIKRDTGASIPNVDEIHPPEALHDLLSRADGVINVLPHTQETEQFFGAKAFAAMKSTAVFINIGRGATVDESALVNALKRQKIRAASLDVFEQEPLPENAPIRSCNNVLITAHYAGISPHLRRRSIALAVENLELFTQGHPLRNVVNKAQGY